MFAPFAFILCNKYSMYGAGMSTPKQRNFANLFVEYGACGGFLVTGLCRVCGLGSECGYFW